MSEYPHHHHHHHHGGAEFGGGEYPAYPQPGGGYPQPGGGYPGGGAGQSGRQFWIVSEMDGKVVDIEGAKTNLGAKICAYTKKNPPANNQLWYEDQQGYLRSVLNNLTFGNTAHGNQLKTEAVTGNPRSQWRFEGQTVASMAGEVLDIKGQSHSNDAEIISYKSNGQKNQQWRREYV